MSIFGLFPGLDWPGFPRVLGFDAAFVQGWIIQLVNTAVLVLALGFILYKPVLNFIKSRTARIQQQVDEAAQNLAESETLKKEYEEKIRNIDAERDEILEAARVRAREKEAQIIADGHEEAELYLSRARLEMERELEKAKDDMKTEMVELSTLMAGLFIEKSIDPAIQNQVVEETLKDLEEEVSWQM